MEEIEWDVLYKNALKIGISPLDFWNYTLFEKNELFEAHIKKQKENTQLNAIAVRCGVYSALSGKAINLFESDNNNTDTSVVKNIDVTTKREELNKLKNIFGESI